MCICVTFPFEIARVTLVSFEVQCDVPPPILATLDDADGTLYLNMGDRSVFREHGDLTDGAESFRIKPLGADSVMVEAFGYTQVYGTLQDVAPGQPRRAAVTRIVANGGNGNDVIEIDPGVLDPAELRGGNGDDIIIAGGGAAFIQGGAGRDVLKGSSADDRIYGFSESGNGDDGAPDDIQGRGGNDQLYGQGGADQLDGGEGNDSLYGGAGKDNMFGGAGDDSLYGGLDMDLLYGEQGNDLLMGESSEDWLYGGAGDDLIYGFGIGLGADDGARDLLFGDLGAGHVGANDRMGGTSGNDSLYGQLGDDYLAGEDGDDQAFGGGGNDEILGGAGADRLDGDAGNDLIRGGNDRDTIRGGTDQDTLYGDAGADELSGDAGHDSILGGTGEDLVLGGSGNDTVRGQEGHDRIYGELGDDLLYGDAGEDLLLGGDGADQLVGGEHADRLYGGAHNDLLYGSGGDDQLYGEDGDDQLQGNTGRDRLYGGAGNDVLSGNEDDDHLQGEVGADSLFGNAGEDLLEGGEGADFLSGGEHADVLLAGVGLGKILQGDGGDDILVGADSGGNDGDLFDGIYLGDRIHGGLGNDRIWGLGGADRIEGGDGDDEIHGGEHGDLIYGQSGTDRIFGGFGQDALYGGDGGDVIDGGLDADQIHGEAGEDELSGGGGSGDALHGGADDDVLRGSDDGADQMQGGSGRDRLYGNGGNDHLRGDDGDDILEGQAGDDLLEGGAGADVLLGGAQHDVLFGHLQADGSGLDVDWLYGDFGTNGNEAGSGADQLFGQGGNDLLFGEGGDDRIDLLGGVGNGVNQAEAGGGNSNVVDFGAGEVGAPGNFTPPLASLAPAPVVTRSDPFALASLPTGSDVGGLWRELAGSASGHGVSGGAGLALEPSVATDALGRPVLAWADARNGNFEIYVLRHNGSAWEMLGGSALGGGISATAGSSRQPALAFAADGSPVVAWIETGASGLTDVRAARFDAAANGGAGAWVALGASLGSGGLSATGQADQVRLVATGAGLVAVWLDDSSGTRQVYARRFDGGSWVALGSASGAGISAAPADATDLAVATDGTRIAVAWARLSGDDHQIHVRQFNGSLWQDIPGASGALGLSDSAGDSRAPALAYVDGMLVAVWQNMRDGYQNLQGKAFNGVSWASLGTLTAHGPASDNATIARDARLASGGGDRWLFWTDEDTRRSDQPQALYAEVWNGSNFVPRLPGDAAGDGISESGGRLSGVAVGVDASGRPLVAWSEADRGFSGDPALPAIYLRTDMPAIGNLHVAANDAQLQDILAGFDLEPGDVIQLGAGSFAGFTVTSGNAGVTLIGAPGQATQITGPVVVAATDVSLQGLVFGGNVSTSTASDRFTLRDGRFLAGQLVLGGGEDLRIVHNRFGNAGVRVQAASSGAMSWNDLAGTLDIDAAFSGRIDHNSIHSAAIGVDYGAAADLRDNRIFGNGTGIRTTVAGTTHGLGFTAGAGSNEIFDNSTGILSVGAQFQNQWVRGNGNGVGGSGVIGGSSLDLANRIEDNQTGVANFTGTVQYSRIAGNTTGIAATNGLQVAHNLVYRNSSHGLLVSGVSDVRVYQNTFYAPTGDNIRLQSSASNVEVRGNILWARAGYNLYVANDSQAGFFSDYNNLYADQGGRIGYWTRDFTDVLDWQADIARFDLHSIGATVVNPLWAKPQFLDTDRNDFRLFAATAGLRFTSPDLEGADARLDQAVPPHYQNLLTNAGFEAGLTGWSASAGAGVKTGNPTAFEGSQYFSAGNTEQGQVQQTVDLLAAGFTAARLDAGDLDLVFGGRTRSAAESPVDRGQVSLQFFDASSQPITLGNGSASVVASALNGADRWELVGGRALVPVGARFAVLRFTADRDSGTSNDAWFDKAFLLAASEAYVPDLGAYGHATHEAAASADTRILLRFPDMYTDWEKLEPLTIRWETVNNTTRSPVRIDLIQDGPDGPAFVLNIASGTADDGEFIWIPGNSGIDFGTHGLRIQLSLVHDLTVIDRSQESFSVPEDGGNYYVDDGSNTGDQTTPGASGSNRHTGKTPDAPKPNPVNVLREYTLDSFSSLFVDTGDYPMIYSMLLSGSVDTGLGLDEGFLLSGPTNTAVAATLFPAIAGDRSRALVELNDADFMTVRHLSLRDADRGLYVRNGSDAFEASWITAWGHDQDGMLIESNSPFGTLDHLTAYGNTRFGIQVDGDFAAITDSLAYGNGNTGIYVTGGVDLFADNLAHSQTQSWGIYLGNPGNSQILRNESRDNRHGMFVSNGTGMAWVGSLDLAAGNGNRVHDNNGTGLSLQFAGVHAAGNTVYGQDGANQVGLSLSSGAQATSNLVYDNHFGIDAFGATVTNNRVYHNSATGIQANQSSVNGNVVYSNARGVVWSGSNAYSVRNNLVYDNSQGGFSLSGSGLQFLNNTVVQDTGNAVTIDNASGIRLFNNILWAGANFAVAVSSNSQVGFESDFNLFYTTGGALVGQWQGSGRNTLNAWRAASFTDANSLFADPLFVDRDGADGVIGYASGANDGRDDDLHLSSLYGSAHGGSLAPVRDLLSGLPVVAAIGLVVDDQQSPAIDRGRASDSFALEPLPNGGFINIGAYGGTAQASRSPDQYVTVIAANGGESVPQESNFDIRWRAHGFAGTVDIEISADGGGSWNLLADSETNDGSYSWNVNPAQFAVGPRYLVRVSADADPSISDVSDHTFLVTEPISLYYVNLAGDLDFSDNEYTVAAGSDLNDGLTPATPMASIRAVLERYDLDDGDVILVDTGNYQLTTNIGIAAQDSGVVIRGAVARGHQTVLDRGNTGSTSYIFQLSGADRVVLDRLAMTGAFHAVYLASNVDSDNVTVSNSEIYRNANHGVVVEGGNEGFVMVGNAVRENGSHGIVLSALRGRLADNDLWGNAQWGIVASISGAPTRADWTVVEGNRVFDNAHGIFGGSNVEVRENEVWGNNLGLQMDNLAVALRNEVWGNSTGIQLSGSTGNGVGRENRVWGNGTGMAGYNATFDGNRVYGNTVGIRDDGYGRVTNNLVYDNTSVGIQVTYAHSGGTSDGVVNNTVHQVGGRAIEVTSAGVVLRNNVVRSEGGTAVWVSSTSQSGFVSDYNLFDLRGGANLAFWEGRAFANRTDWYYETGFDEHSTSADAQFVNVLGADGVNGWSPVVAAAQVLDDEDAGHVFVGTWAENTTRGYAGDFRQIAGGDGSATSNWTFTGLQAGTYRVAVTWPQDNTASSSGASRYTVRDGGGQVLAYNSLNQNFAVPNDFNADGAAWETLGLARLEGDTLVVSLSNFASARVLADAVRIERLEGDAGADDDYHLQAGSPGVDRGAPLDNALREPQPNGARRDVGAYGNTAQSTASADPLIQVLGPNGLEKIEVGQSYQIDWRSAGLAAYDPLLLINTGNEGQVGEWVANSYQTVSYSYGTIAASQALSLAGVSDPAPESVYRSYVWTNAGVGNKLAWSLPLQDGEYTVRLHFMDPSNIAVGQRQFDIALNGAVVADNFDIRAQAGAAYKAVVAQYNVSASGGTGVLLELLGQASNYGAVISGIEVLRANAQGVATPTAELEVSLDGGANWSPIASGLAMDGRGRGSYVWVPTQETAGNQALIRVTGHAGDAVVQDQSDEGFLIANGGQNYYVNMALDADLGDNEYTTAAGNNANSGKSADAPMASLAALLRAYDLDAGDTVYVDTGVYSLATNIVLDAQDSGVRIQGPQVVGHTATLNRGNTADGRVVFQLSGADNVTLSHLAITGGQYGIQAANVDSDNLVFAHLDVFGNTIAGIDLNAGNDTVVLRDSYLHDNNGAGANLGGRGNDVRNNRFQFNTGTGLSVTGLRSTVQDNVAYGNSQWGIVASTSGASTRSDWVVVEGNRVFDNAHGIFGGSNVEVRENEVWGNNLGLQMDNLAVALRNEVWGNSTGIQLSGSTGNGVGRENRVWGNGTGMAGYNATFDGNRVYGNTVGIRDDGYGRVTNNLVYDNTSVGIQVTYAHSGGTSDGVVNNTVHQVGGRAIEVTSAGVVLRNNVVRSEGGTAVWVSSTSQSGFVSDYNLFDLRGGANLAFWEGRAFANRTDWYYETGFDEHSTSADAQFVNVLGADGVNGWSPVVAAAQVLDDEDAGHVFVGTWAENTTRGYAGDFRQIAGGDGSATSNWTFTGLQAGTYRVAVTWPQDNTASSSGASRYTVRDGGGQVLAYNSLNQNFAVPNDFNADGAAWETLGLARLEGDTLVVSLSNFASARVLADAVRIERLEGDAGADDDYHLQAGSPGVDRGAPLDNALREPQPNGARRDVGAYGNTAQSTASADPLIQVLGPNGLEKIEVGQSYQIDWRSAGLAAYDPLLLINTGNEGQVGEWVANSYQTVSYSYGTIAASQALSLAGVSDPAPESVYRSYVWTNAGVGNKLAWSLPLQDGEYTVRLHFMDPSNIAVGQRQFDIALNGAVVADNFDIRAQAGAAYKAVVAQYNVSASGGTGVLLELLGQASNYGAVISGIEVLRANAQGVATPTAELEVSLDGGANWSPIASGLAMDGRGRGSYVWVPTQETAGNQALIRVTGHAGDAVVQDQSDEGFLIANGGQNYYVNMALDADLGDNEYTTAAGNNANSGKSADAPMASLAALLRAYDLDAGDTVYVDTGVYSLATNIVLDAQDSGVRIQGPQVVGHTATLNRGNTADGRVVFQLSGADNVTLSHLAITGGQYGIQAANVDSDGITVRNSDIFGNTQDGIQFSAGNDDARLLDNLLRGNGQRGIEISGARALLQGNEVFGNGSYGLYAYYNGTVANRIVVRDNQVHDNSSHGMVISGEAWVTGNEVFGHTASNIYGIYAASSNVLVQGNDVRGNTHGIFGDYGSVITGNEVYGNAQNGVTVGNQSSAGAQILGNRIYGNSTGVSDTGYGRIDNNVLYANTNVGISVAWRHQADDTVSNNTIYQPVGDAIRLQSNADGVQLFNNILWVAAGYGINANPGGVTGLVSDYNLIHTAGGAARVGLWGNVQRTTLADWQTASTRDAHSTTGDPLFLDIDGADNVLGATPSAQGDGKDDNFGLRAYSPAIDAANAYKAPMRDIEGRERHDDPSSSNSGDGWPLYVPTNTGANSFVAGGVAKPYQTTQGFFNQTLGFSFEFYGATYTQVAVSTEGYLQFAGPDTAVYQANDLEIFQRNAIIAPFWDNLTTSGAGRNIFVDTTTANQITFRWSAAQQTDTTRPANFSATLFADGTFRFDYGAGNTGFKPRVGVSSGNGVSFVLSGYSGSGNLASANSLSWAATPGLEFFDIGAYEFQGDSSDVAAPTVTAITRLPADGGSTALAFSSVQVSFSESLDGISARSPANYELLFAGADGLLDTLDDMELGLTPAYSFPETDLTLQFNGGVLADGLYRLRLSGTLAIFDTAGNALDGDANGTAGGDYLHVFTIDRSSNTLPVAAAQTVTVNEDGSVLITLSGSDADSDPLGFGLATNPARGTLSGFDPVARQVTYTPSADFWGTDSFQFQVDDGKLGTHTATVTLQVAPVNDAPLAPGQSVTLGEDNPVQIVLPAQDKETQRNGLGFTLVAAPTHGSLTQGANGLWNYLPDADYFGSDSFTYTVTDRGGNDADPATALTSAAGTIQLTVTPANDAPTLAPIANRTADEGELVTMSLIGQDPEGQPLTYSLVSGPAGATVHPASGLFSWTALDGDATVDMVVQVSDGSSSAARSFQVVVNNLPPVLNVSGAPEVDLGDVYLLALAASDPGADTLSQWEINWGDGNIESFAGDVASASHTYALDGDYTILATATDEDGSISAAPVAVRVISPNRAPVAPGQFLSTPEEQPLLITLVATDADGDMLSFSLVSGMAHGTLGPLDPVTHQLLYTPDPNYVGHDTFVFQVTDGQGGSATATINVKVLPVNDAPEATPQSVVAQEDTPLAIQLAGTDTETAPGALLFNLLSGPAHGSLVQNPGGSWSYIPNPDYAGTDSFQFSVTDAGEFFTCGCGIDYASQALSSAPVTVSIQVMGMPDAPRAQDDSFSVGEDGLLEVNPAGILGNDSDPDGDSLGVALVSGPSHGQLTLDADGGFTYTPNANFQGQDSFTYTAGDGVLDSAPATVTVTVLPVNDVPVLAPIGHQNLVAGQSLSLSLSATDPDAGDTLTYSLVDGPVDAVLDSATGMFQWTAPYADAALGGTVTVAVSDGNGGQAQRSFQLTVQPELLTVTAFEATPSGYQVRFSRAVDSGVLNLFDGIDYSWGAADAVLRDASNRAVAGSIVLDPDSMGYRFVKTGTPLLVGSYSLTLESRAGAFGDTHGRLLDGDADGVAGGHHVRSFTQAAFAGATLSIPDFARGAGQDVNLPASGSGLPVRIANAAGATAVSFTLGYDAALLDITGVSTALPGASVSADFSVTGRVGISVTGLSGLTSATTELVRLVARVPDATITDRYGAKQVLDLRDVQVNGGAVPARGDDGVHVAAYLGDTSGNAVYTSYDAQHVQRVLGRIDTGFGAYPLADPTIVGNVAGNGFMTLVDVRLINQKVLELAQTAIPPTPGYPAITYVGADPLVSLGSVAARSGEQVTVPVQLDTAAGLASVQLRLAFPADALELLGVRLGSLTTDFDLLVVDRRPGLLQIDMSSLLALAGGAGSLLELDFRVAEGASGVVPLDLQWVQLNETHLTLQPEPMPGADPTDGAIHLAQPAAAPVPAVQGVVMAPLTFAAAPVVEPVVVDVAPVAPLALPALRFDRMAGMAPGSTTAGEVLPRKEWLGQWLNGSGADKVVKRSAWRLFAGRP